MLLRRINRLLLKCIEQKLCNHKIKLLTQSSHSTLHRRRPTDINNNNRRRRKEAIMSIVGRMDGWSFRMRVDCSIILYNAQFNWTRRRFRGVRHKTDIKCNWMLKLKHSLANTSLRRLTSWSQVSWSYSAVLLLVHKLTLCGYPSIHSFVVDPTHRHH